MSEKITSQDDSANLQHLASLTLLPPHSSSNFYLSVADCNLHGTRMRIPIHFKLIWTDSSGSAPTLCRMIPWYGGDFFSATDWELIATRGKCHCWVTAQPLTNYIHTRCLINYLSRREKLLFNFSEMFFEWLCFLSGCVFWVVFPEWLCSLRLCFLTGCVFCVVVLSQSMSVG